MRISTPDLCDEHPDDVRVVQEHLVSYGGRESFGGGVVTLRCCDEFGPDNTLLKELVGTSGDGRVVVVDVGGRSANAVLGDLVAQAAADHGWAGVVLNGMVRDVEVLRTIELGVRALGSVPVRSNRRGVGERDVAVELGDVTIVPGDHLYADASGVVVSDRPLV